MSKTNVNWLMVLAVVLLAIAPLVVHHGGDVEFSGADGQAEDLIAESHPAYEPLAEPLWEPPSGEIESLLFALQAAIGAGLIGFYFGRRSAAASPALEARPEDKRVSV